MEPRPSGAVSAGVFSNHVVVGPAFYTTNMSSHAYGLSHAAWLAGIACVSALVSWICRRNLVPHPYVRAALICLLVGGELSRLTTATIRFPGSLPLQLCNVTTWVGVLACLSLSPLAVEFVYLVGFSAASMSLLSPDFGSGRPAQFFLNHGAIIVTASALIFGRITSLRPGAVARAYAVFMLYMGLIGLFDWKYKVNYVYLRRKPGGATLLDLFGPWPYYLVVCAVVALTLLSLMWFLRPRPPAAATRPEPAVAPPLEVYGSAE
jgi:hypothetical integral membrane protein (TIGR02206 family)